MRRTSWTAIFAMAVVTVAAARANANDGHTQNGHTQGCTDATLRGTYGIQIQGTRPSSPTGPIESVIGVVIRHYDGHGQFTQIDNVKGSISGIVTDREGFGTYQVNADCTAITQTTPGPGIVLEERLVITKGGRELVSITSQPPPVMVTAVHRRLDVR